MQVHCLSLADSLDDFWKRDDRDAVEAHFNAKLRELEIDHLHRNLPNSYSWCLRAYVVLRDCGPRISLLNLHHCDFRSKVITYRLDEQVLTVADLEARREALEHLWAEAVEFVDGGGTFEHYWDGRTLREFTAPGAVVVRPKGWKLIRPVIEAPKIAAPSPPKACINLPYRPPPHGLRVVEPAPSAVAVRANVLERLRSHAAPKPKPVEPIEPKKLREFLDWWARGEDPNYVVPEFAFFMVGSEHLLTHYWTLSDQDKARGRRFIWRAVAEFAGQLNSTTYPAMAATVAAWRCGLTGSLETSWIELNACDFRNSVVTYVGIGKVLRPAEFEPHRDYFETLWQGPVEFVDAGQGVMLPAQWGKVSKHPGCVTVRRRRVLPERIQLGPVRNAEVTFGVELTTGERVTLPLRRVPHTLVAGTTGFGKSVFLHQLIQQLLQQTDVERLYLVDLKAGIEFARYEAQPKATVVWEMPEVFQVIDELAAEMDRRLQAARGAGREFNGPRIFGWFMAVLPLVFAATHRGRSGDLQASSLKRERNGGSDRGPLRETVGCLALSRCWPTPDRYRPRGEAAHNGKDRRTISPLPARATQYKGCRETPGRDRLA